MAKRRIVVLSDGTGNSSAAMWRTNVWRTFEALDLSNSDQVAFYDDGVGTSTFKPLALLGGAFGFGLKRNVIDIYKFVCRNYHEDDDIFGFGFSRGAFTIRVVTGLILDQGLVQTANEIDLDRLAKAAFRDYHTRKYHTVWWELFHTDRKIPPSTTAAGNRQVNNIRFLGLWDTVAAYGLPVDEMTRGVNKWIWPLELPNRVLSPRVQRACHALALDDERTTFHPVLWDESAEPTTGSDQTRRVSDERISQVWFSGMHSNVGGGYPDDSLARIPQYWIMTEAQKCGLRFKSAPNEKPSQSQGRAKAQESVWNTVWKRRIVYFSTVLATATLVIFPLLKSIPASDEYSSPVRWISDLIRLLGSFLPSVADPWVNGYARSPIAFVILAAVAGALTWLGVRLASEIKSDMGSIWQSTVSTAMPSHVPTTTGSTGYETAEPMWPQRGHGNLVLVLGSLPSSFCMLGSCC
jgi:uncharacterized protein (DUF2235 family)